MAPPMIGPIRISKGCGVGRFKYVEGAAPGDSISEYAVLDGTSNGVIALISRPAGQLSEHGLDSQQPRNGGEVSAHTHQEVSLEFQQLPVGT